jgi:hypothetical protein
MAQLSERFEQHLVYIGICFIELDGKGQTKGPERFLACATREYSPGTESKSKKPVGRLIIGADCADFQPAVISHGRRPLLLRALRLAGRGILAHQVDQE